MAITTIKTLNQLRYAINNARQVGTFKVGETLEEFAASVLGYIDYCEDFGCKVLEPARPDIGTMQAWHADMTLGAYVRRQLRDCLTAA